MRRRHVLYGGVAVGAAAAGLGWSLYRAAAGSRGLPAGFWDLRFEQPDGGVLMLSSLRGQPLLLNFWATWCPPCVAELPLLDRFHRRVSPDGWNVVGLAIDGRDPVREFLDRRPVGFPIGLAGPQGVALSREMGNVQGALPFSVLLDAAGRLQRHKLGALHADDLDAWRNA